MVSSLDERDFVPWFVAIRQRSNAGRSRALAVEHDALLQLRQGAELGTALQFHVIGPGHRGRARHQPIRQITVVGEQHQTGRVIVEPSDGVNALLDAVQKGDHFGPAFRVANSRDVTRGFVQQHVDVAGGASEEFAVHFDVVALRIGLRA